MDASRFDHLARVLGAMRTRRAAATLVGAAVVAPLTAREHVASRRKKRRKKCAKTCKDGCCTGKYGKCIQPAKQSVTRCGEGGEACRSSGCPECTADRPCPDGSCCRRDGTCGACLVFVTSTAQAGSLGGLAGADAICQNLADNVGLPGAYMAWLSTATQSPVSRFTRADVPYTLTDDTPLAENWAGLVSGTLAHAINKIETGGFVNGAPDYAWTNTTETGAPGGLGNAMTNCLDWTSAEDNQGGNTGRLISTNFGWTFSTFDRCNQPRRLYCFQQR
ncbi:MAG: hypothetical protein U0Z70_00485 [Thermomicrobiales bacterium]